MQLNEIESLRKADRAGLCPYYKNENGLYVHLMIPSNPAFGGKHPQIAKGIIEHGETPLSAAIREAEEELGLKADNILTPTFLSKNKMVTHNEIYTFFVFTALIYDPANFGKPHFETGYAGWWLIENALAKAKKSHLKFLLQIKDRFA